MRWQERISDEVKEKINIDMAAKTFARKIAINLKNGMPKNYAERMARISMLKLLKEKGLRNTQAVVFLHQCEVTDYSGCGCCEHRKPKSEGNYYYGN